MNVTTLIGELTTHREIMSRVNRAVATHNFSLIVIFPTQSLLQQIQEELLDQPEVSGFGGVRFLLFEGFIREIRERFRLNAIQPSSLEKELIIQKVFSELLQNGNIDYLSRVPFTSSYRRAVLDGIAEWKRSSLTPELFQEWAIDKGIKEQELGRVYELYQQLLIENGFTDEDLTLQELQWLRMDGDIPERRSEIILYGFTDLTPLQNDFIKALEWWFEFEAIVDPTPVEKFQEYSARHLNIKIKPQEIASEQGSAGGILQKNIWRVEPVAQAVDPSDLSLQLIESAGLTRQATAIAREISGLMHTGEYLGDDFLIIDPSPQNFCNISHPVFREYGLNLNDPTLILNDTPLMIKFRLLLRVALDEWLWPDMKALIRWLYVGAEAKTGDRIVLFLAEKFGALSGKQRWLRWVDEGSLSGITGETGLDIKPLQKAIQFLADLPEQSTYQQYITLTTAWFNQKLSVRHRWSNDPLQILRQVNAHTAIENFIKELDKIKNVNPLLFDTGAKITLEEYKVFLDDYFLNVEVKGTSPRQNFIKVIPPREARGLKAKIVFITGLEQGSFPRVYVNDWKIGLQSRRDLKTLGVELETGDQYQIQEQLAFYWSIQTAGERLYLSYQAQDQSGQMKNRSVFLNEVIKWFPGLLERAIFYPLEPRICSGFSECRAPMEISQLWSFYLVKPLESIPDDQKVTVEELARKKEFQSLFNQIFHWRYRRNLLPRQSFYTNPKVLRLLETRYSQDTVLGITSLEDYRMCPYRFFLKHLLRIRQIPKPQLLPEMLDLGNLLHQVLRDFLQNNIGKEFSVNDLEMYWDELQKIFTSFFDTWVQTASNDLVRVVITLHESEIKRTLYRWLCEELQWAKETGNRFHPGFLEFSFGNNSTDKPPSGLANQPLILEWDEQHALISGRIDRIDIDHDGQFIVYDYKLGKGPSTKELKELKRIQIPAYILAVSQLSTGKYQPVGGCYLGLKEPSRKNGSIWHQERLGISWKSNNLYLEDEWNGWLDEIRSALIDSIEGIRAGYYYLTENDCLSYCEYQGCCRKQS